MVKILIPLSILSLAILTSCKVQSRHLIGKYVDTNHGDTLLIHPNKSYEYFELLNSGNLGWTHGQWKIKNNNINFISDNKPLVDYKLKVRGDTSKNDFQIKLLLADTEKPVNIEDVKIIKNNEVLGRESYSKFKNEVKVLVPHYDSIMVYTAHFKAIPFPNTLNKSHGYTAKIYPEERLYELDKVPFKLHKATLLSAPAKLENNALYTFKK